MISALFNCLLGPCLKTSALMMVIPHESEFKLILFDPPPWSSQNVPDPVQKYFTAPSVPDHDEAGFRVLTVLMPQNGGRAGAGALLAAPGWGRLGDTCSVSPGVPSNFCFGLKRVGMTPLAPLPPQREPSMPWQPGEAERRGQACHGAPLLAISLAAPSLALFFRPLVIKTSQ